MFLKKTSIYIYIYLYDSFRALVLERAIMMRVHLLICTHYLFKVVRNPPHGAYVGTFVCFGRCSLGTAFYSAFFVTSFS